MVMAGLVYHFWRQVFRRSAVGDPLLFEEVAPAKISELDPSFLVDQNILRLDVAMDDGRIQRVEVLDRADQLAHELSGDAL